MDSPTTNRELLQRWQAGDEAAAQILVDRYLARLTALARARLSRRLARRVDAEDVVMSAWRSFFVATGRGRVRVPEDDNLWPVLVTLTLRKLARQAARHQTQRRDLRRDEPLDGPDEWMAAIARDPQPDQAAALIDELELLLSQLPAADREIATRRLRGEQPAEIAVTCGCSQRTVRRVIRRFRELAETRQQTHPPPQSRSQVSASSHGHKSSGSPPRPLVQPTRRFDELVLEKFIGFGGFGKLYRARDRSRDLTVAVKFLRKSFWSDQQAISALVRETQLVSRLSHSGIVEHYGWGRSPGGAVFVVLEWIDGPDLAGVLRNRKLSVEQARNYGLQVADAVSAAHAAGIVHGDLTPSNVLVGTDCRLKLTDFGFAASLLDARQVPRGGTPGYLAPEQLSEVFGPLSEQTDVYGFGGLMFALLSGRAPWTGADVPEVLARILSSRPAEEISRIRKDVPAGLAKLIGACLQKEPADRPESMQQVRRQVCAIEKEGS